MFGKKIPLETAFIFLFLFLLAPFLVDFCFYLQTNLWIIHGGLGAFRSWPIESSLSWKITLHASAMLLWILIVIHQLLTKGKGIHRGFGYAGAVLLLVGLGFSWGPLLSSKIPSLHHFGGVTLMEITLGVNVLGIAAEFLIALCKIGQGDIKGHRLGMMSVVVFTAGPGVYRYCVWLMTWALGLQGADASVLQTTWVHEFSLSAVILLVICMLMLPSFSGHKWELKKLDGGSGMKILSRLMCVLYIGLVLLYSGFLVSLAFMWPKLT